MADQAVKLAVFGHTAYVMRVVADFILLTSEDGGLTAPMPTPCRSLLLRTDAGPGVGTVSVGVSISTASGEPLRPGASLASALFAFWDDIAEVYLSQGRQFELCYPNRVVGRGVITSVHAVELG